MGYSAGFDMAPPIEPRELPKWRAFLDEVRRAYRDEPIFKETDLQLEFTVGEHPALLKDGTCFRRFSSKVSGPRTREAEPVLEHVRDIARRHFGTRVKYWRELYEQYGPYSWSEIHATKAEARKRLEAGDQP